MKEKILDMIRTIIHYIFIIVIIVITLASATFITTIFVPEQVLNAVNIFKNLF